MWEVRMGRIRSRLMVMLLPVLSLVSTTPVRGEDPPKPQPWYEKVKLSGLMFGDAYYFLDSHLPAAQDAHGFWFRRIYLTYDQKVTDEMDIRVRFEAANAGNFVSGDRLEPFLKDAYMSWKKGRTTTRLGLSITPAYESLENAWGYRAVEKTPLDLQRWTGTRDLGVAVKGSFDKAARFRFHTMYGNGADTGTETNEGKKLAAAFDFGSGKPWLFEIYGDLDERPDETDRRTVQTFASYSGKHGRWGVLYAHQWRDALTDAAELDLDLISLWGVLEMGEKANLIVRVDRQFDPNPEGEQIPYLSFDPTAKNILYIVGVEFPMGKHFSLIPNVEYVDYEANALGVTPQEELVVRATFSATF
jgi:hypothetical protein